MVIHRGGAQLSTGSLRGLGSLWLAPHQHQRSLYPATARGVVTGADRAEDLRRLGEGAELVAPTHIQYGDQRVTALAADGCRLVHSDLRGSGGSPLAGASVRA